MFIVNRALFVASLLCLSVLAALVPIGTTDAQAEEGYDLNIEGHIVRSGPGPGGIEVTLLADNIGTARARQVLVAFEVPANTTLLTERSDLQCSPAGGAAGTECVIDLTGPFGAMEPGETRLVPLQFTADDELPAGVTETVLYLGCGSDFENRPCSVTNGIWAGGEPTADINPDNNYTNITIPLIEPPANCLPGTYSSTGVEPCVDAPAGHFVATEGATSSTPCPLGRYQPAAGQVSCFNAPIGTYVDTAGAIAATPCPAGTSTIAAASASSSDCLADFDGDSIPDVADPDDDNDGVMDVSDRCDETVLAADPAPNELKKNRTWSDADGNFIGTDVTVADTGGCSASQIIAAAGLGNGHVNFGISGSALADWIGSPA